MIWVIFDNRCGLCQRSVQMLKQMDRHQKLRYIPLSEAGKLPHFDHPPLPSPEPQEILVWNEVNLMTGSDAILYLLQQLPFPWKIAYWVLRIVPHKARQSIYRAIARNRYRWFGNPSAPSCSV